MKTFVSFKVHHFFFLSILSTRMSFVGRLKGKTEADERRARKRR